MPGRIYNVCEYPTQQISTRPIPNTETEMIIRKMTYAKTTANKQLEAEQGAEH